VIAEWKPNGELPGQQFYDWICQVQPELANHLIFTISGTNTEETASRDMRMACQFLRKPFRIDQLLNLVTRSLGPRDLSLPKR
jgi:DNA-binding NtrC family response regulator